MNSFEIAELAVGCVGAALVGVNFLLLGELKASERARSALVTANTMLHENFATNEECLSRVNRGYRIAVNALAEVKWWAKTPPGWASWGAYASWRISDLLAASVAYRERAVAAETETQALGAALVREVAEAHARGYVRREQEERELVLVRGKSTDIVAPRVEAVWRPKVDSAAMHGALVVKFSRPVTDDEIRAVVSSLDLLMEIQEKENSIINQGGDDD